MNLGRLLKWAIQIVELDFRELRDLLAVINQTDIAEFTLKSGDFELVVRKGVQTGEYTSPTESSPNLEAITSFSNSPLSGTISGTTPGTTAMPVAVPGTTSGTTSSTTSGTTSGTVAPSAVPLRTNERFLDVISPMVGTFYRSPAPDELPFVEVGDRIRLGQTVCIIEAMKLMNELEAEVSGEIVEILLHNGEPVEYGQVLMRVNPG